MSTSNFDFLKNEYPELAKLGSLAEELIDTDAASCLSKLRLIAEFIAKDIYYRYFHEKSTLTQYELLKELKPYIKEQYMDVFHIIRKYGNGAVHENIANIDKTHDILKYTWGLCVWHYVTNCNGDSSKITVYSKPVSRKILLEQELEEAKKRAELLEAELKIKEKALIEASSATSATKEDFVNKQSVNEETTARLSDLTEAQTRHFIIDNMLIEAGWNIKKIENFEIDIKEFNTSEVKREICVEGLINTPSGKGYIDYALYNDNGRIIAIIEAKKSRRDVKEGKEQAKQYANAIERNTNFRPLIFYTNGFETYLWDDANYPERRIFGMFSKDDILTRLFQRENRKNLANVEIDTSITNRDYQFMAIRKTYEAFSAGQRKALLVMATGTGKTRTAMSIIKGLVESNWVKRVLFLVDRDELRKQADSAFKKHLDSLSRVLVNSETRDDKNNKVYIATYPAMQQAYQLYTPGFFDLIIADESHRSIYNVYGEIFKYFDAFQIGLTATPVDYISRNTYKMFNTDDKTPTFSYELDDAISEKYLVPYKVQKVQTGFMDRGIKFSELSEKQKQELAEQVEDPEKFEFESSQLESQITNVETNRKIIRSLMDNGLKDSSGKLGKSIIFARNHKHGQLLEKLFNEMYPQYKGEYARLIDSHDPNASILLDDFKGEIQENKINIAISVSMLDTGVDVPEILNLVFAKPIYSKVKFWQMIGRGTRLCENLFGLNKHKEHFVIFDHYANFEFFGENPEGYIPEEQLSLYERLFQARIELAISSLELGNEDIFDKTIALLKNDIESLPKKSVDVQENAMLLDNILKTELYWQNFDEDFIEVLDKKVRPLMRRHQTSFAQDKAMQFEILTTQYETAELDKQLLEKNNIDTQNQDKKIEYYKNKIRKSIFELRTTIYKVKEKNDLIEKVKSSEFGKNFDYNEIEKIRNEISPLMQYRQRDIAEDDFISIDISDEIEINEELQLNLFTTFGEGFKHDLEEFLKKLSSENIVLQKIKKGQNITELEIQSLVSLILEQNPHFTLKQLEKLYPDKAYDISLLIRSIIGIDEEEIKIRIRDFQQKHSTLNTKQMQCLKLVENQLRANNYLKETSFFDRPFTGLGDVSDIFTEEELEELYKILDGFMIRERTVG
ncbi:MAG: DEAD/DEAH box helicase family protein [Candidatus Gastranaerophilales bacterium]|nr:DEAD/DEAH box helicase family protein [Candidatus Gastranaerophilales bacterium]